MSVTTGLFYVFSAILLLAAFRVITARNPIHAVLYLVLTFFQAAMIWMLLKAEFLSITLVLVYVGAVMVLFLFVVMMMDIDLEKLGQGFWKHFPLAAIVGVVIALEMSAVLMGGFRVVEDLNLAVTISTTSNTKELGKLLYTQYLSLGAILFALSVVGIFLNRRNLIVLLMAIELMLLAVNTNFVAFSHYLNDMHGQIFVFFILTVAAAESAIGLAILVLLFRNRSSIAVDELNSLKG